MDMKITKYKHYENPGVEKLDIFLEFQNSEAEFLIRSLYIAPFIRKYLM